MIAAVSALIGAGLGVGGTIYSTHQSAKSAKAARAEDALRAACNQSLRAMGQAEVLLTEAAGFLAANDLESFGKRVDEINRVGGNGEAETLFAASPSKALTGAVDNYVIKSDESLQALIRLGAVPKGGFSSEEATNLRTSLDAMREATASVGVQCRLQIEAL